MWNRVILRCVNSVYLFDLLLCDCQIYGDPEAADVVFTSGANIDVVGINITTQVKLTGSDTSLKIN